MAVVKDRAKVRAALSIVALSLAMSIDQSIFEGTPSVVAVPVEEKKEQQSEIAVKAFGNVKADSLLKAKDLLTTYLDDTSYVDNCVVIEGDSVETFTRGKLKIPNHRLKEGTKVSTSKDVNIYVAENTLDIDIPSIALSINQYFKKEGGRKA